MFMTTYPLNLQIKVCRGQFGYWVSFLAVAANLFFPQTFPGFFILLSFYAYYMNVLLC